MKFINEVMMDKVAELLKEFVVPQPQKNDLPNWAVSDVKHLNGESEQSKELRILKSNLADEDDEPSLPLPVPLPLSPPKLLPLPIVFEVKFAQSPLNLVKVGAKKEYSWEVKLTNSGKIAWPEIVHVYRTSKKMAEIT